MAKITHIVIRTQNELVTAHDRLCKCERSNFSLFKHNGQLKRIREVTAAHRAAEVDQSYELIGYYTYRSTLQYLIEDVNFCGITLRQEN